MNNKVFGIVVLYKPNEKNLLNISSLAALFDYLIIVDNSENSNLDIRISNTRYHAFNENKGLAYALNFGINLCLNNSKCEKIVFLDQDSIISSKVLNSLIFHLDNSTFDILGPQIHNRGKKLLLSQDISLNNQIIPVNSVITSGTIFNKKIIKKIGFLDESLFIDYLDHEWCARARQRGISIGLVSDTEMEHSIGEYDIKIFGKHYFVHTSMLRRFYIIRNNLIFLDREYVTRHQRKKHLKKLFRNIFLFLLTDKKPFNSLPLIIKALREFTKKRKMFNTPKWSTQN